MARADVWDQLRPVLPCVVPTVIHFARFELPFLAELHHDYGDGTTFPFDIVCTHEVACRLWPELPRRGLRALAGYLGHSTHELRRAAAHVGATVFVWRRVVEMLARRERVDTWAGLREWLATPAQPRRKPRHEYPMPKGKRLALPDSPGVYRMLRRNGDLLYVGKATSLKTRVNSYFRRQRGVPDRTLEMLTQACDLSFTPTATPLEAALLEHDEIKQHRPPYNVALIDDGREVWFASPNFETWSHQPSRACPVGPFVSSRPFEHLRVLAEALEDPTRAEAWAEMMALPDKARDHVVAGLHTDRLRWPEWEKTGRPGGPRELLAVGHRLRARRIDDVDGEPNSADEDSSDTGESVVADDSWSPERVASLATSIVTAAAFAWRRAKWWCSLSEATLVWGSQQLVIQRGQVVTTSRVRYRSTPSVPVFWQRSRTERQALCDRATCDRLRVLTTELRREVGEREHVELRLGPRQVLSRERLINALRWV